MANHVPHLLRTLIDRREMRKVALISSLGSKTLEKRQALVVTDSVQELPV